NCPGSTVLCPCSTSEIVLRLWATGAAPSEVAKYSSPRTDFVRPLVVSKVIVRAPAGVTVLAAGRLLLGLAVSGVPAARLVLRRVTSPCVWACRVYSARKTPFGSASLASQAGSAAAFGTDSCR